MSPLSLENVFFRRLPLCRTKASDGSTIRLSFSDGAWIQQHRDMPFTGMTPCGHSCDLLPRSPDHTRAHATALAPRRASLAAVARLMLPPPRHASVLSNCTDPWHVPRATIRLRAAAGAPTACRWDPRLCFRWCCASRPRRRRCTRLTWPCRCARLSMRCNAPCRLSTLDCDFTQQSIHSHTAVNRLGGMQERIPKEVNRSSCYKAGRHAKGPP